MITREIEKKLLKICFALNMYIWSTLGRVMYELEKYDLENANNELQFSYLKWNIIYTEYCNDWQGFDNSIPWKLVNDDWTDATLMDQNEATIVKLYNLLCW